MHAILLVAALGWPDGTVIIFQGGFLSRPIARHTGSTMNHIAVVLDGHVYEATWPCVQKETVDGYKAFIAHRQCRRRGLVMYYVTPDVPYTAEEVAAMKRYAESQVGRRYMIRGFKRNRPTRGIHCSWFVGEVLEQGGRIDTYRWRESPISVYQKIRGFSHVR